MPLNQQFVEELKIRREDIWKATSGQRVQKVLNNLEFDELIQILMQQDVARCSDMHYFAILELIRRDLTSVQKKAAAWFFNASPSNKQETSIIFGLKDKMTISKLRIMARELTCKELVEIGAQ